jgi:hypothetical protein
MVVLAGFMLVSIALPGATSASAAPASGTMALSPANGTLQPGEYFFVTLTISAGTPFNFASADVTVSPNLQVQGVNAPGGNACPVATYPRIALPGNPSFTAGFSPPVTSCAMYSLTVRAISPGVGTIAISNGSIKSVDGSEIFSSATNGTYQVGGSGGPNPPLPKTATIFTYPNSGTYHAGDTVVVGLYVSGGGQRYQMARGTISFSPNLRLEGQPIIIGANQGTGCQQSTSFNQAGFPINLCPPPSGTVLGGGNACLRFDQIRRDGISEALGPSGQTIVGPGGPQVIGPSAPGSLDFQIAASIAVGGAENLLLVDCSIAFFPLRVVGTGNGQVSITNADVTKVADQGGGGGSILKATVDAHFTLVP